MSSINVALSLLFGSELRATLLRFFILNPGEVFSLAELARKTNTREAAIAKEVYVLAKSGFLRKAQKYEQQPNPKRKGEHKEVLVRGHALDRRFALHEELRALFTSTVPEARNRIGKELKKLGKLETLVISGIFLGVEHADADMLIVGEVKKQKLDALLKRFEREFGKDLVYALLPKEEFIYRVGMRDRFLLSLIDHPHEIIVDKTGLLQDISNE